ncbi:MAG: exodeoxyribonuclease III [Desulfurivibrionaceae bacterium]
MEDKSINQLMDRVTDYVRGLDTPVVDLIAVQSADPFKILVATILSARTRDEVTAEAARRLFEEAPDPGRLAALSREKIERLIYPVGFFRNKAGYLAELPKALERFQGEVPSTVDDLLTLPGVGRKTATLVAAVAFRADEICVDTHVHRIMNIWGYVQTSTPLQTEKKLREKLPKKYWSGINSSLVRFGQSVCRPVAPHCDVCPVSELCPRIGVTPRRFVTDLLSNKNSSLKLISWNVNGIRALAKKGFREIVDDLAPDVLALQETKAHKDQLPEELVDLPGYSSYWHGAEKKGYSGVAVYSRIEPRRVWAGLGEEEFDREGRVITLEFDDFFLVNVYFPNSGEELKRLDYKLQFNESLLVFVENLRNRKSVVVCGDYNVAHKAIDLRNPDRNENNAGFTPQERRWMDDFLASGFVDTFRMFTREGGHYTWWSYRFNARAKDIGWRIDYFCIDSASKEKVKSSVILKDVMGSDHCPVEMEYSV